MAVSAPRTRSITERVLFWLADALYNHRRWFFYPQLVLVGLSIFYTIENLKFLTSRDALVGGEKKYHRDYLKYKKEFPTQDDLVVVVESENAEKNRQFVERLGAKLEAARIRIPVRPGAEETVETNLFARIFYKGDLKMLGSKALLFVPEEDLAALKQRLQDYQPFI